ncbi:MAG TPA: hypothetical protein VGH43_20895 [Jatrophihabitans sp.]
MTLRVEPDAEPAVEPPTRRPSRSIIAPAVRPFALVLLVAAGAVLAVLSFAYHGDHHGTSLDDRLAQHLNSSLGSTLSAATLHASDQRMTVALLVLVVVGALLFRRWDVAVFAAASPILAIVLTEVVLKPIVDRYLSYDFAGIALPRSGAFPSGHETGLASLTAELAVLALRAPIAAAWRGLVVAALALWTAIGAVGLVANLYHYATDTVGGVCVAIAVVLGVALLVDAASARLSSLAARTRPSTSRAA